MFSKEPRNPTAKDKEDFLAILGNVRALRFEALKRDMDPWYFRQALVFVLRLDTLTALEHGVLQKHLDTFDELVKQEADRVFKIGA
jgi:hypothetical protein